MADSSFADLVKVSTATTGTGTMTLGSAVGTFRGTSALTNGATYSYVIFDGSAYELGQGVYTSSGTTLTRVTVDASSNSGSKINLSGSATVIVGTLVARDLAGYLLKSGGAMTGLLDLSNAAAGQIKFPATANTSANANTLDAYAEGTFTAGVSFGGATTGITYAFQQGEYTRIGRKVTCLFSLQLSSKGSATGVARITGLPFAAGSIRAMTTSYLGKIAFLYSTTTGDLKNTTTGVDLTDADFTGTDILIFVIEYFI